MGQVNLKEDISTYAKPTKEDVKSQLAGISIRLENILKDINNAIEKLNQV